MDRFPSSSSSVPNVPPSLPFPSLPFSSLPFPFLSLLSSRGIGDQPTKLHTQKETRRNTNINKQQMEEENRQHVEKEVRNTTNDSTDASNSVSSLPLKRDVWLAHPRENSYGCLLVTHADANHPLITAATLSSISLSALRFLLVQRRSTGAWSNMMNEMQVEENSPDCKNEKWFRRELQRFTNHELDRFKLDFDSLWSDESLVSSSWKVNFKDCKKLFANLRYQDIQKMCDEIRTERQQQKRNKSHDQNDSEDEDVNNLSELNFVLPKGQLQTTSSVQRQPHLHHQIIDADIYSAAKREVLEETGIGINDFVLADISLIPPFVFSNYPPNKVEIFMAFLQPSSQFHPSRSPNWMVEPNPETLQCRWFQLQEIYFDYFEPFRIFKQTYTHQIITLVTKRFEAWNEIIEQIYINKGIIRDNQQHNHRHQQSYHQKQHHSHQPHQPQQRQEYDPYYSQSLSVHPYHYAVNHRSHHASHYQHQQTEYQQHQQPYAAHPYAQSASFFAAPSPYASQQNASQSYYSYQQQQSLSYYQQQQQQQAYYNYQSAAAHLTQVPYYQHAHDQQQQIAPASTTSSQDIRNSISNSSQPYQQRPQRQAHHPYRR